MTLLPFDGFLCWAVTQGDLKYPVTGKLECAFFARDSAARQRAEKLWQIVVVIDPYGFFCAVFFPIYINLLVLSYLILKPGKSP